jgi:hypothetical protein
MTILYKGIIINCKNISEKNKDKYVEYQMYIIDRNIIAKQKYHEKKSNKLICDFINQLNMF